jgi:hypothetical protein
LAVEKGGRGKRLNLGIVSLIVAGDALGGIGDLLGEVRDASLDGLGGVLALASDRGDGAELANLFLKD